MKLDQITMEPDKSPPVIGVYGAGGIGKTTFAASFPNPIFVLTEAGTKSLGDAVAKFPKAREYNDVLACLHTLYTQKHEYKTVIIDSITRLEPLIWQHICQHNSWESVETPGFAKGYVIAADEWIRFMKAIEGLQNKGMCVVLIAHDEVRPVSDPTTESYDRFQMRLHKKAEATVREGLDILGYLAVKVHADAKKKTAVAEKHRTLHVHPSPAFTAKCRYKNVPPMLEIPAENGASELLKLIKNGGK